MDREAAQARLNRIRGFNSELAALEQAGIVAFTWGPAAARAAVCRHPRGRPSL